jgi:hypothetical protein
MVKTERDDDKSSGFVSNKAAREAHRKQLMQALDKAFEHLAEVDRLIDKAGKVLDISQPPMSGKYGVRWWKRKPDDRYREPYVVRWVMGRNGRLRPKPAKKLVASHYGKFAINAKETQTTLDILKGLLRDRETLKKRLNTVLRGLSGVWGYDIVFNNEMGRLVSLRRQALLNLVDRGYETEPTVWEDEDQDA